MAIEANDIAPAEPEQVPTGCYFSGKPILDMELAKTSECFSFVASQEPADKLAHNLSLFSINSHYLPRAMYKYSRAKQLKTPHPVVVSGETTRQAAWKSG